MKRRMIRRHTLLLALLCLLAGTLLFVRLEQVPPVWMDEGWTLSLARNWVELGHYGHLLMGRPVPLTSLNSGLPVVAPVALSFRLLGVGLVQGRLPGVLFTLGALAALWYLSYRLYDRSTANWTLAGILLLSVQPELHPILVGR